ncbi:hypothetical protein HOR11_gp050 [Lactobacillus phage SA-C12]|uniref:Uncharacterized protein n=1 Tax=Lactobacillus phage SA-C12 TaxID=1755697 RepID=A0A1I9KKE5_9CAUD|nr:hypothetical protein HOR11_gp050 [Lactobacillus phage SA-C12]ALY06871.1 hypothetical protein SAC12_050 [Lactobacillus phage SA-C12]
MLFYRIVLHIIVRKILFYMCVCLCKRLYTSVLKLICMCVYVCFQGCMRDHAFVFACMYACLFVLVCICVFRRAVSHVRMCACFV